MKASTLREQLKRYARKAGINKRVHPHGLRHTHAFELANEAIPLHVIQAQLGHSSLSMTSHYIDHLAPQQIFRAIAARQWPGGSAPAATTRAAGSQGAPAPLSDGYVIPAYTPPTPSEPSPNPLVRVAHNKGAPGAAKARILEVLASNGGRATSSQLKRALRLAYSTITEHCEGLAAAGEIVKLGEQRRQGGRPLVIWALPAPRAVYQLDPTVDFGSRARRGHGAARVLQALTRYGGRASQAQLAGQLGINSETVGHHCRALEAQGKLERGGLDKSSSNRGSQVWALPRRERFSAPTGHTLKLAGGSSTAGVRRRRRATS